MAIQSHLFPRLEDHAPFAMIAWSIWLPLLQKNTFLLVILSKSQGEKIKFWTFQIKHISLAVKIPPYLNYINVDCNIVRTRVPVKTKNIMRKYSKIWFLPTGQDWSSKHKHNVAAVLFQTTLKIIWHFFMRSEVLLFFKEVAFDSFKCFIQK